MSTQNVEKVDLVRPEDKEKDVLNRFTDLCIRKKDRGKQIRWRLEQRGVGYRYPELLESDALISDEKTMEDILKLYMDLEKRYNDLKGYTDHTAEYRHVTKQCDCLDHIVPTCEYHKSLKRNK